jgi:hypothetical protein
MFYIPLYMGPNDLIETTQAFSMCLHLDEMKGLEEGRKTNEMQKCILFPKGHQRLPWFSEDSLSSISESGIRKSAPWGIF